MLFTADAHAGLASGAITVTYRVWARPQVRVGGVYRVGSRHLKTDIWLAVDAIDRVAVGSISATGAIASGHPDRSALVTALRRRDPDLSDTSLVYRIGFHRVAAPLQPDPARAGDLTPEEVAAIERRLKRLERNRPPWAMTVLGLIRDHPAVVSTLLAQQIGQERFAFKDDVRRLKRLGLTESLRVGYRLSPRGRAFLEAVDR
jgi:hypothetical protein